MGVEKVEELVLDKDAIALVVNHPSPLPPDARLNIRAELQHLLKTEIPVIVLCGGMKLQVVRASDAVVLEARNEGS